MSREFVFAVVLTAAAIAVVVGVAQMYQPAAWVVGGALAVVLGWLLLAGDDDDRTAVSAVDGEDE